MDDAVFVAIDSGGSRGRLHVEAREQSSYFSASDDLEIKIGSVLEEQRLGRAIVNGMQQAGAVITDMGCGHLPIYLLISSAGFSSGTRSLYSNLIRRRGRSLLGHSLACAAALNDATSVLLGTYADAAVVAGTGSVAISRNTSEGSLVRIGGDEWVTSDVGSGFEIGWRAIREMYWLSELPSVEPGLANPQSVVDDELPQSERSEFVKAVAESLGLTPRQRETRTKRDIRQRCRELSQGGIAVKVEVARTAETVCRLAGETGNTVATEIVKRSARTLATHLDLALDRAKIDETIRKTHVTRCGSLFSSGTYSAAFDNCFAGRDLAFMDSDGKEAALTLARWLPDCEDLLRFFEPTDAAVLNFS